MKTNIFIKRVLLSILFLMQSIWALEFSVVPNGTLETDESGTYVEFTLSITNTSDTDIEELHCTIDDNSEAECKVYTGSTLLNKDYFSIPAGTTDFSTLNNYTFRVYGKADNIADGDQSYKATVYSTVEYNKYQDPNVILTSEESIFNIINIDDGDNSGAQVAKVIIDVFDSISSEDGTNASFSVVLSTQPTSDVTINMTSSNIAEGVLLNNSLTFTPSNWNQRQRVDIQGVDDSLDDGNVAYNITFDPLTSSDSFYSSYQIDSITLTNNDNEVVPSNTIVVTQKDSLITSEDGSTIRFGVSLGSQPTVDETVSIVFSNANVWIDSLNRDTSLEHELSTNSLTFTTSNWNEEQIVTVTGLDDSVFDGTKTEYLIFHTSTSRPDQLLYISNSDNEGDAISYSLSSNSISESGTSSELTISLNAQPTANVTVYISSLDTTEATVDTSTLTFTTSNWDTSQSITITGVDDSIVDFDKNVDIRIHSVSADSAFLTPSIAGDFDYKVISLINSDDESFSITESISDNTTSEFGKKTTFSLVLDTQPETFVRLYLNSSNSNEGEITSPSTKYLDFTPDNWSTPQSVEVTGLNDYVIDGVIDYNIEIKPQTRVDAYDGTVVFKTVALKNINDNAPVITNQLDDIIDIEDGKGLVVDLVTTDIDNDLNATPPTYNVTSSNTNIATVSVVDSRLIIVPIENKYGTTTITLTSTVNGISDTKTFTYTLNNVNDSPTISNISDVYFEQSANEITKTITFDIWDDLDVTSLSASSSNESLLSNENLSITKTSTTQGKLTYTIPANNIGETVVTLTAKDEENLEDKENFKIKVNVSDDALCVENIKTLLNFDLIKSTNLSSSSVIDNLNLVNTISSVCDANITWTSTDSTVVSNLGVVTQSSTNKTVALKARISLGEFNAQKSFLVTVLATPISDSSALEMITFDNIKANNLSKFYVASKLNLIDSILGKSITWSSSDDSIISSYTGFVTRTSIDNNITLSAKIGTETKDFELKVPKIVTGDENIISKDKELLTVESILGENIDSNHIIYDLVKPLPSKGLNGSTILWSSSNTNYLTNEGYVLRDSIQDRYVVLSATISSNNVSVVKDFTLKILQNKIETISSNDFKSMENSANSNTITTTNNGIEKQTKVTFSTAILDIVQTIVSQENVKTAIEFVDKLINVYLNTIGSTHLTIENSTGDNSTLINNSRGATTSVDLDSDGDGNISSVSDTQNGSITLKLNSDNTVSYELNDSEFGLIASSTTSLPNSSVEYEDSGTARITSHVTQNNSLYKVVISTDSIGNTVAKYVKINKTNSTEEETKNVTSENTPFSSGSSVNIVQVNGEIYISTRVPLDGELVIE